MLWRTVEFLLSALGTILGTLFSALVFVLSAALGLLLAAAGWLWTGLMLLLGAILSLGVGWQIVILLVFLALIPGLALFSSAFLVRLLSFLPLGSEYLSKLLKQFAADIQQVAENTLQTSIAPILSFDSPRKGDVLYYGNIVDSVVAAMSRESFLSSVPDEGPVFQRFFEVPPGYSLSDIAVVDRTPTEAVAHGVRLRWERASGETEILFGRASDTVRAVMGRLKLTDPLVSLSIRRLSGWERRPTRYPWIVSIGYAGSTEPLKEALASLKSWIGIGVEIVPPLKPVPYRVCGSSSKCEIVCLGTVAGLLRDEANDQPKDYAITCDHVVPTGCTNVLAIRPEKFGADLPDAVLLLNGSRCFPFHGAPTSMAVVSTGDIEDAVITNSTVKYVTLCISRGILDVRRLEEGSHLVWLTL